MQMTCRNLTNTNVEPNAGFIDIILPHTLAEFLQVGLIVISNNTEMHHFKP